MRKNKLTVMSAVVFIAALICASHTNLYLTPGLFLLFFISQIIIVGLQCHEVIYNWRAFKEAKTEERCERKLIMALHQENIFYAPYVMTLRTIIVMFGINPERAGPSFAM